MMFSSKNPATEEIIWQGEEASEKTIQEAIKAATSAQKKWQTTSFAEKVAIGNAFTHLLDDSFAELISKETGKPLWDSKSEVEAMKKKVEISIAARKERCPTTDTLHHKPHGTAAVFGPFNFPGHLAHGHIAPLLLAGNTILFKPSELTPAVGEKMGQLWKQAGLPDGVLTVLQGGASVGKALTAHPEISGIYFTGSYSVGQAIVEASKPFPNRIVALEMGGNNPLIISSMKDLETQVLFTIQSGYITSGQRCSAARRLIVIKNDRYVPFLELLIKRAKSLIIAPYTMQPEPFMGPLVSPKAAVKCLEQYNSLIARGAAVLMPMKLLQSDGAFLSPGLIDCTKIQLPDEEIFGPLLQLFFVNCLDEAIEKANETAYGLTASILTDSESEFTEVLNRVNAGVINWNAPTTGASSHAPFGGTGKSGNFRPAGYYSADYASYPVASQMNVKPHFNPGYPNVH